MAETINMPKLGFDMAEGTLVRWLKKVGEAVNKGEVLAEIETDKATVEVESSASGVVRKLLVEEGTSVPVNSPIALVGTADEKLEEPALAEPVQASSARDQSKPIAMPEVKPTVANSMASDSQSIHTNPPSSTTSSLGILKASPLARKIAHERNIELGNLRGSGPGGRIVRRDVEAALDNQSSPIASQIAASPLTVSNISLEDGIIPLSKLRQAIARRMTDSKTTIPHFYVTHEYKVDALIELRRQLNNLVPENEKISINDFIVKAVGLTLRQFPNLNTSFNGASVAQHGHINIGVAVSVEGGLLTIVCREADRKPLRQVSAEVKAMAVHVRDGKVRSEEIEGSTFSISNMGMFDVENFAAIINPPETAILAVGSAREVPVVIAADDRTPEIKSGWRMKATISVDHRASDGVEAAKFMQALALFLEEPLRLVI